MFCDVCDKSLTGTNRRKYCSSRCSVKGWKKDNREKYLDGKRKYRERNNSNIAEYHKEYRKRIKPLTATYGMKLRENYPCLRCNSKTNLEVHHIKHQSLGGLSDDFNNLVVLCKDCHVRWHRYFPITYWD